MVKITNWSCGQEPIEDTFLAPEQARLVLIGEVVGHPRKPDGLVVRTSPVVKVDGRIVTTNSGTVYELGDINPDYLDWLCESGRQYDYDNPIKVIGKWTS